MVDLIEQLSMTPDEDELLAAQQKRYKLQKSIELEAQRLSATHEGLTALDTIKKNAEQPGFFESYIFGPLTYLGETTARGFTSGKLFRGGELLRRDTKTGLAGWETVEGFDVAEAAKAEVTRAPVSEFSDATSEGILSKAILNFWDIEDEPRPETFLEGVKGIATDQYDAKTVRRLIRTGASTAQFLAEVVLDTVTDPLAFVTGMKPVHLFKGGGETIFPTIRRISRGKRREMLKNKENLGVQILGHGVIAEAARNTAKAGAAGLNKSLEILVGAKKAKQYRKEIHSTLVDVGNSIAHTTRIVDGSAWFRTQGRAMRIRYGEVKAGYSAALNNVPVVNHEQLTQTFKNVGLGMDKASKHKRKFMAELLDEGHLVPASKALDDLPRMGTRSVLFNSPEEYIKEGYRVKNWDWVLSKAQRSRFKQYIKKDDIQGLMDDAWRANHWLDEIGKVEQRRGLLGSLMTNYVPRIFKSRHHLLKAIRNGAHVKSADNMDMAGNAVMHNIFLPFSRHRRSTVKLSTLDRMGYKPEMDLALLMEKRSSHHLNNLAFQDYVQGLLEEGGKDALEQVPRIIAQGNRILDKWGNPFRTLPDLEQLPAHSKPVGYTTPIAPVSEELFPVLTKTQIVDGKRVKVAKEYSTLMELVDKKNQSVILRHPAVEAGRVLGLKPDQVAIPDNLYKEIARATNRSSAFRSAFNNNIGLQMLEAQTNLWRRGVTVINPAFYFTNIIGDIDRQFSELGVAALNPKRAIDTYRVLKASDKAVRIGDASKTGGQWLDEVQQAGILGNFQRRIETTSIGQPSGRIVEYTERAREIVGTPVRKLREAVVGEKQIGQHIEDWGRTTMYLNARAQGFTPQGAVDVVHNTLFNYFHGLTEWEREVARRVVPFYSFLRFNAAFQAKQAILSPGRVVLPERASRISEAGSIGHGTDGLSIRNLLFPFEEALTTFGGMEDARGRPQMIGLRLPVREFWDRLPRNFADGDAWRESMSKWFSVMHPALQGGMRYFTGQELNYGGRDRDYLYHPKFQAIFHNTPSQVRDVLGVHEAIHKGQRTFTMDPMALALINIMGFGRLLSSYGHLEQIEGVDIRLAEGFYYGDHDNSVYKYWTPDDLTTMQGVVSALLGQPMVPFGVKQVEIRQARKLAPVARKLRDKRLVMEALGKTGSAFK